jgi:hypothetical protein
MDVALTGIKSKEPDIVVKSSPNELFQVLQNLADTAGEKVRISEICSALGDHSVHFCWYFACQILCHYHLDLPQF